MDNAYRLQSMATKHVPPPCSISLSPSPCVLIYFQSDGGGWLASDTGGVSLFVVVCIFLFCATMGVVERPDPISRNSADVIVSCESVPPMQYNLSTHTAQPWHFLAYRGKICG